MPSTDEELIDRVSKGDPSGFTQLYDRHSAHVLGLLTRLLPTRSDADDVLQEVFLTVWKTAGKYQPGRGSVRVWVFLIARSRAMDWHRRRKLVSTDEPIEIPSDSCPLADMQRSELSDQVQAILGKLPDEQREPIALAFYQGLTHQEISLRLGIPLGTAKTRIRLGMQRLRDLLSVVASTPPQTLKEVTT
ncbi:MAG: sigma-70 family RNA polymerase sigma factor [Planctomycetota bacterium]